MRCERAITVIKNRFYAAFYYERLFRPKFVESNDPYDAIVIAAEQKKKRKKVQLVSSIISLRNFCIIKRERERETTIYKLEISWKNIIFRLSRFFKLIRDNIFP